MSEGQPKQGKREIAQAMKTLAVKQAMTEVLKEQQVEIIRRAHAKLVAMGIDVESLSDDKCGAI